MLNSSIVAGRRLFPSFSRQLVSGCLLVMSAAVSAEAPAQDSHAVLRQAALYQHEFRAGKLDMFPAYPQLLEQATANDPGNAELWYAKGVASFAQAAATMTSGGKMSDVAPFYQQGQAALEQALTLDPEHPEALALRAGTRLMMAAFAKAPEVKTRLTEQAVAEMNRAIALDPQSKRARLQRAFSGLSLSAEYRDHAAEAEDLDFLITESPRSREGDYVQLMRADLNAELGMTEAAADLYQKVSLSKSPAALLAKERLNALAQGGVAMTDIQALRTAAGSECVMCHGK